VPLAAFKAAMPVRIEMAPGSPVPPAPSVSRTAVVLPDPVASNRVTPEPEERNWTVSWQAAVFGIWLAIALLRVRGQRRLARPILDDVWTSLLHQVRADLGVKRRVELVQGSAKAMPMTWGWRRPVILVPAGAEAWPEPRRRAVLLHELAHVARGDYATQIAAEIVRALYWFNPLVWTATRRLRLESEQACDDRVLTAGAQAADYAGDLLDIARSFRALRAAA